MINKIFKNHQINKNSIDIISCVLDYIKENIFKKYLQYIFKVLEYNNLLTILMEISKDRNSKLDKDDKSNKNKIIIKEFKSKFLKEIKEDDIKYEPKFLFNYKIPEFYNFYRELSDYLTKNIAAEFFVNEKNIFVGKEKELFDKVLEKISQSKLYFGLINKITPDLILKDYIIFYLEKYIGLYMKSYSKANELLLNLKFLEENKIIKDNSSNPISIIIIKIIWLESITKYRI